MWYDWGMEPEIIIFKASDFNSREALENGVITKLGKTAEKKDAKITGTVSELLQLQLSQGQSVWGVVVEAEDFIPEPAVEKPQRGPVFKSSLNYSNDETNKDLNRREGK